MKTGWHLRKVFLLVMFLTLGSMVARAEDKAYVKLVNQTRDYVTVTLYVDSRNCGSAPIGQTVVCPVSSGKHFVEVAGATKNGRQDRSSRSIELIRGATYTWTVSERSR